MNSNSSNILDNSDIRQESSKQSVIELMFRELNLPQEYPDYSNVDYWNSRYAKHKQKNFEWLQNYYPLQPYIQKVLQGRLDVSQVLYAGCGNSQLQDYMYQEGVKNIKCVDFSDVLIRQKQNSYLPYFLMDVTQKIDFEDGCFDLIIDKGLLDSIMCGEAFFERTMKYLSECRRVLKRKGKLMILSYGHPDTRTIYLKHFECQIIEIPKTKIEQFDDIEYHYLYICEQS